MPTVSPKRLADALSKQESLSPQGWLDRCDELAVEQRVMFLELVTFARDGVTEEQLRELIGFLSVLQYLAKDLSQEVAAPVEMPEFSSAVERVVLWFKAYQEDWEKGVDTMIEDWLDEMDRTGEPVIWSLCTNTLQQHGILQAPLASGMMITLYAIADVFAKRCAKHIRG